MKLRTWSKKDISAGTRVIVRVDANVPMAHGKVADTGTEGRLAQSLPELQRLLKAKARLIIVTHLSDAKADVAPIAAWYAKKLKCTVPVRRLVDLEKGNSDDVVMLENIRVHQEEERNDVVFARRLASLADVYVNNAFGVCHRRHASVHAIAKVLPAFAGELVVREVVELTGAYKRPSILLLGGAKLATKLPLLRQMKGRVDDVLVGGATCLPLLVAAGMELPSTLMQQPDAADIRVARRIVKLFGRRLILPDDLALSADGTRVLDIGPESTAKFIFALEHAKSLIWNGPLGVIEEKDGITSTRRIASAIKRVKLSTAIVGGGDSVDYLAKEKLLGGFTHVSTGGGAMLALLSGEKMPGLDVLRVK